MKEILYDAIETPAGTFLLAVTEKGACWSGFEDRPGRMQQQLEKRFGECRMTRDARRLKPCSDKLKAYFAGEPVNLDMPLDVNGTVFQQKIWKELSRIPYGETISYEELARRLGNPKAMRAAGAACGQNPVGVIVPCHRVVGKSGKLTGFASGVERKEWLLNLERRVAGISQPQAA